MQYFETDNDSSDVRSGTNVEQLWNFYTETQDEIRKLEMKLKIFRQAYLDELSKCHAPHFFHPNCIDYAKAELKGNKEEKQYCDLIMENIFETKEFIQAYNVSLTDIVYYGAYDVRFTTGFYLCFTANSSKYQFYVPNFQKEAKTIEHDIDISNHQFQIVRYVNDHYLKTVFSTFDWKEACSEFRNLVMGNEK